MYSIVAFANTGPGGDGISVELSPSASRENTDTIIIPAECAEIIVRPAFVWVVLYVASGGKSENLPDLGKYLRQSLKCMANR